MRNDWYWFFGWVPTLLTVIGNGLVIYLIATRRKLHTINNRFVLSLAMADLFVGLCFYPGQVICHFWISCKYPYIIEDIGVLFIYSSVSNLCAMALDRYIAIVKPLQYISLMTSHRASVAIATAWLFPISAYFIPSLCASLNLFGLNLKVSVVVWTTMFEFIPCTLLLVVTVQAVITSRRHNRHDAQLTSQIRFNQPNIKIALHSASSLKVMTAVVAMFLSCYAVEVYSSFCHFTVFCNMREGLFRVVHFLVIVNSVANPVAYALFKRDIKSEFDKIFRRKRAKTITRNCERTGTTSV
ncbi:unnamed protein product [Porites lobata]|uniref:G-protein coupled receptors family 1 profile domain-containing protein n=1 Tax=Porites lobata TaxID=104759 RepID=A0ABN8N3U7_9CNID|nr:unnamed protein product [Porites lobata]